MDDQASPAIGLTLDLKAAAQGINALPYRTQTNTFLPCLGIETAAVIFDSDQDRLG